jgi:GTP-binding protein EngB required for normal cell division
MIENMYEPQDEAYDDDLFSYDCDYVIKMILVGDLGVGKSSMLLRYAVSLIHASKKIGCLIFN